MKNILSLFILVSVSLSQLHALDLQDKQKLLTEAEGFYKAGRFDLSSKRCKQILSEDPNNSEANALVEKIDIDRKRYEEAKRKLDAPYQIIIQAIKENYPQSNSNSELAPK